MGAIIFAAFMLVSTGVSWYMRNTLLHHHRHMHFFSESLFLFFSVQNVIVTYVRYWHEEEPPSMDAVLAGTLIP